MKFYFCHWKTWTVRRKSKQDYRSGQVLHPHLPGGLVRVPRDHVVRIEECRTGGRCDSSGERESPGELHSGLTLAMRHFCGGFNRL